MRTLNLQIKFLALLSLFVLVPGRTISAQDLDLHQFPSSTFDEFAKVSGQLLNSGLFHNAGTHSPGGFDISAKLMLGVLPSDLETGAYADAGTVSIPILQANVGISDKWEVGGRFVAFSFGDKNKEDINILSGIIKYNLVKGIIFPSVSVFTTYNRLTGADDFTVDTFSGGATIGKSLPLINFYGGALFSHTILDISLAPGGSDHPEGFDDKIKEGITSFVGGFSFNLAPFSRINAEYGFGEIQTFNIGIIVSIF